MRIPLVGLRPGRSSAGTRSGARSLARCAPLCALLVGCALLAACVPVAVGGQPSRAVATATPPTLAPAGPVSPVAAQLAARAQQAIGSLGQHVEATYDASKQAATLTVTIAGTTPFTDEQIATAHNRVKVICYWVMSALWSSGAPLREVTAIVLGPMQDAYANIISDWYGVAVVGASDASRIDWPGVGPYTAWGLYDQAMLRVRFDVPD